MAQRAGARPFLWEMLGRVEYEPAVGLQERLRAERIARRILDVLLLLEHPPVLTIGRGGNWANVLASEETLRTRGIRVHRIGRGGDVTYHGPGQLVGYPILDLRERGRDVHRYLRDLEEVFIRLLARRGLRAERIPGATGVWVGGKKILAIGVGVRKWVTLHGFAFNVSADLSYFGLIRPCGFEAESVTSLQQLLDRGEEAATLDGVAQETAEVFAEVFGMDAMRLEGSGHGVCDIIDEFTSAPDGVRSRLSRTERDSPHCPGGL
ncbi:MAG: lipoyl(octanoyl) transferase LipB [Nitrospinota bacterium]